MNENFKNFVNSLGVLCEMWTLTYKSFIAQGLSHKDAMVHTQGFMTSLITASMQNPGGKQ